MAETCGSKATSSNLKLQRWLSRSAFFALFILAPPLNIFRLDLNLGHFIFFGMDWTLGIDALQLGVIEPSEAIFNLILRGFLPIALLVISIFIVSWYFGRIYCGWLCPHFSVVELVNELMRKASGKPTVWELKLSIESSDSATLTSGNYIWWLAVGTAVISFAFIWAVVLLTYLLPPATVYGNLFTLNLTYNQTIFLSVATVAFIIEFTIARHLFCRYGCALGLFQSYVWMANKRALVVGFDRPRAAACIPCGGKCDDVCPMRLKPRLSKRHMFSCTNCSLCIQACTDEQSQHHDSSLLQWVDDECALDVSTRDFGYRHACKSPDCFLSNRSERDHKG